MNNTKKYIFSITTLLMMPCMYGMEKSEEPSSNNFKNNACSWLAMRLFGTSTQYERAQDLQEINSDNGWKEYPVEWRESVKQRGTCNYPLWDGQEDLSNKRLLVTCSDDDSSAALCDMLMFIRCVQRLEKLLPNTEVHLKVPASLKPLLSQCVKVASLFSSPVKDNNLLIETTRHIPFLHLPFALPDTLDEPKYLRPLNLKNVLAKRAKWYKSLFECHNKKTYPVIVPVDVAQKVPSLAQFVKACSSVDGAFIYGIQRSTDNQYDQLSENDKKNVKIFDDFVPNFKNNGGLLMEMAAVFLGIQLSYRYGYCIAADDEMAHLSAQVGLPTLLLLDSEASKNTGHWAMTTDGETPWYPEEDHGMNMVVFEKQKEDDWSNLLEKNIVSWMKEYREETNKSCMQLLIADHSNLITCVQQ